VRFVADDDLPRSTSGKIKRHELEDRLAGGLEPQAGVVP
jgi:acyl-coenzyme A synthetase/AMP-(fatty) acid ligase